MLQLFQLLLDRSISLVSCSHLSGLMGLYKILGWKIPSMDWKLDKPFYSFSKNMFYQSLHHIQFCFTFQMKIVNSVGYSFWNDLCQSAKLTQAYMQGELCCRNSIWTIKRSCFVPWALKSATDTCTQEFKNTD